MSDKQFTSGPWFTDPSQWSKAEVCIMGAHGLAVAHVIFTKDAPLIAAAPDLFNELEMMVSNFAGLLNDADHDRVYAALSRARGEAMDVR